MLRTSPVLKLWRIIRAAVNKQTVVNDTVVKYTENDKNGNMLSRKVFSEVVGAGSRQGGQPRMLFMTNLFSQAIEA